MVHVFLFHYNAHILNAVPVSVFLVAFPEFLLFLHIHRVLPMSGTFLSQGVNRLPDNGKSCSKDGGCRLSLRWKSDFRLYIKSNGTPWKGQRHGAAHR